MKMKSLLGIVLSLSILQSCQNDETNIIQNEVNNKGITFSSIIDDAQNSRAYDTSWEANDVIGVFMLANNSDKNVLATNIPYATSKGDGYFVSKIVPYTIRKTIVRSTSLHIILIVKLLVTIKTIPLI